MSAAAADLACVTRLLVTFNSAGVLGYSALDPATVPTLAVDNASRDDTVAAAAALGYRVLPMATNAGYSRAIMAGLAEIGTEFALIANPDVRITPEAIAALVAASRRYLECDLFVPRILRPDGSEFFRYETRFEKRVRDRRPPSGDACVVTVSGAALLVRVAPFVAGGGFDTDIFLYFEDDELSLRYRQQKKPIVFVADASVQHLGNASSPADSAIERIKNVSFGWSWAHVMARYGAGRPPLTLAAITGKLLVYALSGRWKKLARQRAILSGFVRKLKGEPAPYLPLGSIRASKSPEATQAGSRSSG